jgi:DnaK suppressor protein
MTREHINLDTNQYRQILVDLKREVSGRIDSIDRDIRHEGMSADWSEQASERENDEVLESLGNSSEQELSMIKFAIMRIDEGNYFHCAECGNDIPLARLDLLPFTAHCVNCAEKIEH